MRCLTCDSISLIDLLTLQMNKTKVKITLLTFFLHEIKNPCNMLTREDSSVRSVNVMYGTYSDDSLFFPGTFFIAKRKCTIIMCTVQLIDQSCSVYVTNTN